MGRLEGRVRRLEAKAAPYEAIRILATFTEPDGSESVPHVLLPGEGTRPATAAEIAGEGAGYVVTMRERDDFRL
ncbi:MAG: hypothetical protein ACJAVR_003793 [Paracoccaceae bacterium]|jgi:hypothetical protein